MSLPSKSHKITTQNVNIEIQSIDKRLLSTFFSVKIVTMDHPVHLALG